MKRNGKIIKMNPETHEGNPGLFLIYRKNNPAHNPENENEGSKNQSLMRTALLRALKN